MFRYLTLVLAVGLACTAPVAFSANSKAPARAGASRISGAYTAAGAVVVVQAAGDIRSAVNRYRSLLGRDNGGAPTGNPRGRREINWDSVPDQFAEPNALPGEFFNAATAPRARGAVLTTPGNHVAVSARANNPTGTAVRFADINPSYASRFQTFSPERLFSPIGSNVLNLLFRVPGTHKRAIVRGFGAVYTDVDLPEKTGFRYYDVHGRLLGAFTVPAKPRGLSFLGVRFPRAVVARVRIEYGNHALGSNDGPGVDVAVMDDFIYGEPRPAGR